MIMNIKNVGFDFWYVLGKFVYKYSWKVAFFFYSLIKIYHINKQLELHGGDNVNELKYLNVLSELPLFELPEFKIKERQLQFAVFSILGRK